MFRRIALCCLSFVLFTSLKAQSFTLSGRLQDAEARTSLQGATVVLRSFTDTTLTYTSYTDTAGRFRFDDLGRDSFRLTITSVGYETLSRSARIDSSDVDMDVITVPRTSRELGGVTVTTRIPPAQQKGDTIQFDANQFKVNPDASAGDLARKIPGLTVENGEVKAQGENVRRVTIDGRELFGDDATAALRNLPAEVIDKIQVFDRLSDQAQFTGFDDGNTQKEINIVTKANMRNGQYGRVFGGYGTDERYQAGGNATFLKEDRRVSLMGNFNNINQQNFSQQDLLGVTSGSGRGGRGGGGGRGNWGGGGSNNFLVGQQPGINRTKAFGINYTDLWGPKLTVTGSYLFNHSTNTTNEQMARQYFLENVQNTRETNTRNSQNTNHRLNMRLEYRIDSNNQLIITPNLSFQDNASSRLRHTSRFYSNGQMVRDVVNKTSSDRSGYNFGNNILYRHAFAKKGRTFSVNLNTSANNRDGGSYTQTETTRYTGPDPSDTVEQRFTDQFSNGHNVSANFAYTEPLSRRTQLQFNYNPSFSRSAADQEAFRYDPAADKYSLFDSSLSNQFENTTRSQNAGLSFRTGDRDNTVSFGANFQRTTLMSDRMFPTAMAVNKSFNNILPNAMIRHKFSPRSNIRLMYRASISTPSVTQLQDVPNITNRPYVSMGNPALERQYSHTLSARYTFTNTAKGLLLVGNIHAQSASNYIANTSYIALRDSVISDKLTLRAGEELTQPVNLDGFRSLRSFFTFAVPLRFIKTNLNLNAGATYTQLPGLINRVPNRSENMTYSLGTVLASNISENVDFNLSYSANFNTVKNEIRPEAADNYFQHVAGAQVYLRTKNGWFFQNDLTNQFYKGLAAGFNQDYWLWNMSAGKKLFRSRNGEIRLGVFDLLGQNQSISREVTGEYIQDEQNEVLQRYFMLTFTYNLRNFGTAPTRGGGRSGRGR